MVGEECYQLVRRALAAGLRHIDTSENYANHAEIGRAIADAGVARGELFLADKLSLADSYSAAGARAAVEQSLQLLRTTYLDLYMLHHVGPSRTVLREVWIELTKLKAEGKIRTPRLT